MEVPGDPPAFLILRAHQQTRQLLLRVVGLLNLRDVFVGHDQPLHTIHIKPDDTDLKPKGPLRQGRGVHATEVLKLT